MITNIIQTELEKENKIIKIASQNEQLSFYDYKPSKIMDKKQFEKEREKLIGKVKTIIKMPFRLFGANYEVIKKTGSELIR